LAEVFEQDIGTVRLGQTVQVDINAYPERFFGGKVSFIYPSLAMETRTVKVRIELQNDQGLLKPGLFGGVTLKTEEEQDARLAIPDSAIIDSGIRQIVLLQLGEGRFEPRPVKLGRKVDGYYEVLEGLDEGDELVIHANFLIDAESNLKSALDGMGNNGTANNDGTSPETTSQSQHGDH
jgi:Cu(I)/Ag(I) efflux system membrane fusion protein